MPLPTREVVYSVPVTLPERAVDGTCETGSRAAWFRKDALRCTAGRAAYDPCFVTGRQDRALCDIDPRDPLHGVVVLMTAKAQTPAESIDLGPSAWFFELTDGTTCQPLATPGREVEGLAELYGCRYGSAGDADAVLGDLDTRLAVWTVQKVLLNKKTEPPTIKSVTNAAVRIAWR
jgi:hypothetical protein